MSTVLAVGGVLVALAGLIASVVYWIHRSAANSAALSIADATVSADEARIAAMNSAAAAARAKRSQEFDEKAAAVRTATDAAGMLRNATAAGDPKAP